MPPAPYPTSPGQTGPQHVTPGTPLPVDAVLAGGGEMGARMQTFDWSSTPLGVIERWPQSLKTAVQIVLGSRYPMFVWWGHQLTNFYNDAYAPILGSRHPHALGQSAALVWADIWEVVGPQAVAVLNEGHPSWNEERLLIMERYGYPEETYFTFSYSPVADETGGVGGVFCACTEDTARVLSQRRLRTLRELATSAIEARDVAAACRLATTALGGNLFDVPFALLYLLDTTATCARLAGTVGLESGAAGAPPEIDLQRQVDDLWFLGRVMQTGESVCITELGQRVGAMPGGPWPRPPSQALVLPIPQAGQVQLAGVLIAGVSPLRPLDEDYHGFLSLVASSIATAIADARAHEAERQRAEALAELDRAKTAFFSNVSHEFRTPLTLMLGPLEELLARPAGTLGLAQRQELEVIYRNGLRLLKLVNTLLDFARLEAGRVQARYEPTDLATVTTDLASSFRSAIERAGLRLVVACPPLPEAVYVDHDMWEKIVLNLLSNAFKFTLTGEIALRLDCYGDRIELQVRDTGTGIPAHELPHIFERFYRIREAHARTHEGTGIGLALVQELVYLHGGSITVASTVGVGTTFTVTVPTGTAHLPADRLGAAGPPALAALQAEAYVEEALRWLPPLPSTSPLPPLISSSPLSPLAPSPGRILLADDNVDMRAYVQRLLSPYWQVEAVADGAQALAAAGAYPPDLVLTDVMMPGLDGFALLRALRADPRTATVPVILLSARAGEESRVEGLEAGADDYLIKPFAARELLACVEAHLKLKHLRDESQTAVRESEAQLKIALETGRLGTWHLDLATGTLTSSALCKANFGLQPEDELSYERLFELIHPADRDRVRQAIRDAVQDHTDYEAEYRHVRPDGRTYWILARGRAFYQPDGTPYRMVGVTLDLTASKQAEAQLRLSEERFRLAADASAALIYDVDLTTNRAALVYGMERVVGLAVSPVPLTSEDWHGRIHADDLPMYLAQLQRHLHSGSGYQMVYRVRHENGTWISVQDTVLIIRDASGQAVRLVGAIVDITARQQAEAEQRFLVQASALLAASLDIPTLSERLAHLLVPLLGDWCSIDLLQDDGRIHRLAVVHADPAKAALAAQLRQQYPILAAEASHTLTRVLRTGQSWFDPAPSPDRLRATARDAAHWELTQALGFTAEIVIPLRARGRVLGTITCVLGDDTRRYSGAHLTLAEDLAQRAALAFDNARLYQVAQTARMALQKANATLEQRVQERTAALEQAMAEQQRLEREASRAEHFSLLGRLAAGVSHEIRNPLAAIFLHVDLLTEELEQPSPDSAEAVAEALTEIKTNLARVEDLVQDYLSLVRVRMVERTVADLGKHMAVWASEFEALAATHGVMLQVEGVTTLGAVAFHANTLRRALLNLVQNALEAMPSGGTLVLCGQATALQVQLTVQDTGSGIPAERLPHLFEPLYTSKPGGTGLGLYIVQEVIAAHEGQVRVESVVGQGTTFTLLWPRASAAAPAAGLQQEP